MKKTVANLRTILGVLFCLCAAVLLTGTVRVWADEVPGKEVRVSSAKELEKAINDPEVGTIYLKTFKHTDLTIKANENAKNKRLVIDAYHVNITNNAVFRMIDIVSVCDYVENVSGNDIGLFNPEDYHSFTLAENKTLDCLTLVSSGSFNNTYGKYILRKGAKINEVKFFYEDYQNETYIKGDHDQSKREVSLKYKDPDGKKRSYTFKVDNDGRIVRMVSEKVYNFDYNFSYDDNGNLIETTGYDDDEKDIKETITYEKNRELKGVLVSDIRKREESYSFDGNGRTVTRKIVQTQKDEKSEIFYTYNYDEKGRMIYEYVDYGKDSNKWAYYYTYNSKSFLVKIVATCYGPDGQQEGDSEITTYKYNKAGLYTKKIVTCGTYKETKKYIYDEIGYVKDVKVSTDEGNGRVELSMTMEEFKEFNHLLFAENQQEKILENHSSMTVTYYNEFPLAVGAAYKYYITPDSIYSEAADWLEYAKDRLFYQMGGTTDPKNSEMMCIVDLRKDWESYLWRYTPTDENMWMDYDRDQFIGAYKENGKIYLFSRYNEDLSREYAENTIGVDYNGESYVSETVFDEKTHELLEVIGIKETGDTSEVVNRIVFEYDLPEPVTCSALRSAFEAPTENMLNATFVVDPGTKNEISKTFKLHVDSSVGYNVDDIENVEAYSDSKCEKPVTERWDRMSDISRYFKHVEEEK